MDEVFFLLIRKHHLDRLGLLVIFDKAAYFLHKFFFLKRFGYVLESLYGKTVLHVLRIGTDKDDMQIPVRQSPEMFCQINAIKQGHFNIQKKCVEHMGFLVISQ